MPMTPVVPSHLRLVGIVAFLAYLAGAADYLLRRLDVAAWTDMLSAEWLAYAEGLPTWLDAAWAFSVWLGLLGAILLLRRERTAVLPMAGAFIAAVVAVVGAYVTLPPPGGLDPAAPALWAAIAMVAFAALIWLYARAVKTAGWLD